VAIGERGTPTPAPATIGSGLSQSWREAVFRWLRADWRGERIACWGVALLVLTGCSVAMYYAATPAVVRDPDTPTYLRAAQAITTGKLVDATRLPGYPLFIDLVYLIAGTGNLAAVAIAQGTLFVIAMLATFGLGYLVFRRAWIAFIGAALVGTNTNVVSFVKPILTEGLTLFWVTALGLALAWYTLRPTPRRLWLVAGALTVTFMTRPEWVYFPILLLLFMLLLARRAGLLRRMAAHTAGALVAMYAVAGSYMVGNALVNGYFGFSDVQGLNLLGKVMQYHLTGDAPPQYSAIDRLVASVARGSDNPLTPIRQDPALANHHYQLVSDYAMAMILRHPWGFISGVWGSMLHSLASSLPFQPLPAQSGPLRLLGPLDGFSRWTLSQMFILLPIVAVWWALLLWPGLRRTPVITAMSGMALIVMYDLVISTAGSVWYYPRLHTPFDPLLFLVVAGSLAYAVDICVRRLRMRVGARAGVADD
jgi:hypothetical protein